MSHTLHRPCRQVSVDSYGRRTAESLVILHICRNVRSLSLYVTVTPSWPGHPLHILPRRLDAVRGQLKGTRHIADLRLRVRLLDEPHNRHLQLESELEVGADGPRPEVPTGIVDVVPCCQTKAWSSLEGCTYMSSRTGLAQSMRSPRGE